MREVLRQYRSRIPAKFLPGRAILETLPRLSPVSGSQPDPVQLAGSYHAPSQQVVLTRDAPADRSATNLEVGSNVGPEFHVGNKILLATVLFAGPHTWTGPPPPKNSLSINGFHPKSAQSILWISDGDALRIKTDRRDGSEEQWICEGR